MKMFLANAAMKMCIISPSSIALFHHYPYTHTHTHNKQTLPAGDTTRRGVCSSFIKKTIAKQLTISRALTVSLLIQLTEVFEGKGNVIKKNLKFLFFKR